MAAPTAAAGGSSSSKHTGEVFKQTLANVLEERVQRIQNYVDRGQAVAREELARFIWGTARKVFEVITPKDNDKKRMQAWRDAKGMLKELIDFDQFTHTQFHEPCVNNVLEKKVVDVLDCYRTFVMTGEIKTKHPPPKLLGETDEIVCVDKPCMYTCTYGEKQGTPPPRALKHLAEKASASMLLNGDKPDIQIHEYLALKYQFENAVGTREFWKNEPEFMSCVCGSCPYCACTQAGCCNRLDKETSGVMIAAKSKIGFGEIRRQFASEHSLETGGTEKYYLCLVHGEVMLPTRPDERNEHWKHTVVNGRGRVEVTLVFDKTGWKALPYDDGTVQNGNHPNNQNPTKETAEMAPQPALTFYEPIAWFEGKETGEKFTLCQLQIITGRTHQIRFHMQQVGYSLVGDSTYGAPFADRAWCPRVFLHSYQTKFREPFTDRWFEATSPLPQDLGEIVQNNLGKPYKIKEGASFLSRRVHAELTGFLVQYNPAKPLLYSHDPPVNKEEVMRKVEMHRKAMEEAGGFGPLRSGVSDAGELPPITYNSKGSPIQFGRLLCRTFANTGECKFGDRCVFSHPEAEVAYNSKGLPIREGGLPCKFYMTKGECAHGTECMFTHPEDRSQDAIQAALGVIARAKAVQVAANARAAQAREAMASAPWKAAGAAAAFSGAAAGPPWKAEEKADDWAAAGQSGDGDWKAEAEAKAENSNGAWQAADQNKNTWKGADAGGNDWKAAGAAGGDAGWKAAADKGQNGWKAGDGNGNAWKEDTAWKAKDASWTGGGWEKGGGGDWATGEAVEEPPAKKLKVEAGGAAPPRKPLQPMSRAVVAAGGEEAPATPPDKPAAGAAAPTPTPSAKPQAAAVPATPAGGPASAAVPATPAGGPAATTTSAAGAGAAAGGASASPWKRVESRSQPGAFYYWNSATGATQADPPPPWEKKKSRSQPSVFYYWNPVTGTTATTKPEV